MSGDEIDTFENEDEDLPSGPHLKPMEMTPARRKVIEQMKKRLNGRDEDDKQ